MKTFNTIACIIVLVLALVSAVCSYFLYEKRVQFVDGWNQMSEAIHTSAATIDQRGNSKFASKLTVDELSHKKYSKDALAGKLKNLTKQSEEFVKQYDELTQKLADMTALQKKTKAQLDARTRQCETMAKALVSIGDSVNANAGSEAAFTHENRYAGAVAKVRTVAGKFVTNSKNLAARVVELARKHGVAMEADALFVNPDLSRLNSKVEAYKTATNNSNKALAEISKTVNVAYSAQNPAAVTKGVVSMSSQLKNTQAELARSQNTVSNQKNTITKNNAEIARLKGVIADYKRVLNIDPADTDPKVWKRGSDDVRTALTGKVLSVDKDYGYVVINFGNKSTVTQKVGNDSIVLNADIEPGLSYNIIREGKFIATISLSNVDELQSTANIPVSKIDQIEIGDEVVFNAVKSAEPAEKK